MHHHAASRHDSRKTHLEKVLTLDIDQCDRRERRRKNLKLRNTVCAHEKMVKYGGACTPWLIYASANTRLYSLRGRPYTLLLCTVQQSTRCSQVERELAFDGKVGAGRSTHACRESRTYLDVLHARYRNVAAALQFQEDKDIYETTLARRTQAGRQASAALRPARGADG